MTGVLKADPAARRRALLLLLLASLGGAFLLANLEHYHILLRDWILADPAVSQHRIQWVLLGVAALGSGPLVAFATHLWVLGGKVIRARECPPPGYRVIRDTPIVTGEAALFRGNVLRMAALGCGLAAAVLALLLWRLASLLSPHGS